ncbi:MAG: ATP-binding protein, partial [Actinomycetota bacterium]
MLTCPDCGRESPGDFTFCPACGATLAPSEPVREQRKTVTIVFCDVTGSTALGERVDPETLRRVMARYFDEMKGAIESHGGTVEKFIGDAVMAVFGIPRVHEDDALRAVRAAAQMRGVLGRLNKELERDRGVALAVRMGVNTGEVVAGDPAAGQTLVTGDTVNVAARLEQAASPGEVLIGVGTHSLVRDAVVVEPVEPLTMKGKSELVPAFRLVSVAEGAAGRARRLDSPMVGRERQLGLLLQAFDGAEADRTCHLFTVLGPAGVGKSRLVAEFLERLGDRAGAVRGRCLPYGDGITYFPVVEIVKEAAGLADFDAPDVIESKVCAVLEGDELQESVCARVSQLLGVEEAAAPEETHWAIRRFLEARAREWPLVVVFDDIHWAEPALLDLIEHIADLSRDAPLLLLSMARGELLDIRPAWSGGKLNATTLSLEPLADEECQQLIANLLGSVGLPREVAERITGAAEGNPLFVEEMLSMLIDDERLVRSGDSWVPASGLADVAVPPSILALLEARLDRLGPQERAVIERASVVGKVFYSGAIEALFGDDRPPDLRELLMALVRRELVRPDRSTLPDQETYRFRHQLIRDTAYEGLPKDLRASLHEQFAGWLEGVAGDRIDEQEEILAYHLEQAHRYRLELGPANDRSRSLGERAALRLLPPARRASERGDHAAAVSLLRRAAGLLPTGHPDRAEVLYDLGQATGQVGDVRGSFATLNLAVDAADDAGDRARAWLARIARSIAQMAMDPHSQATVDFRAELEQALVVFGELGDEAGLATTWTALGAIEWMPCRYADAERAAELAVAHARVAGDARLFSQATFVLLAAQT